MENIIEPCLKGCHLCKNGECVLYNVPLQKSFLIDEYVDEYVETYLKCEQCIKKELDSNISSLIEELNVMINDFTTELEISIGDVEDSEGIDNIRSIVDDNRDDICLTMSELLSKDKQRRMIYREGLE